VTLSDQLQINRLSDDEARRLAQEAVPIPGAPVDRLLAGQEASLRLILAVQKSAIEGSPDGARIFRPGEHQLGLRPEESGT